MGQVQHSSIYLLEEQYMNKMTGVCLLEPVIRGAAGEASSALAEMQYFQTCCD